MNKNIARIICFVLAGLMLLGVVAGIIMAIV